MSIAEIVDAALSLANILVWPATVVIVVVVLRPLLIRLSTFLTSIRYKGVELSFREAVEEVEERTQTLAVAGEPDIMNLPIIVEDTDPRMIVVKAWSEVEAALEHLGAIHGQELDEFGKISTYRQVQILRQADIIPAPLADVLLETLSLRNLLVHAREFNLGSDTAKRMSRVASRLVALIERLSDS